MPSPVKSSPFPESEFTRLWKAVVLRLSTSPYLNRVKGSELWEGGAASTDPFALDELPALRVTPAGGAFTWADECRFQGPLILEIRYAVRGSRASDLFDFWQAVARSLSPTNEFMDILYPLGCYNVTMSAPALRPKLICDGQAIEAEGHITLLTNVSINP
jgi:hypothetical protein